VWAGIPIITLGRHISTPVACTELSKINDLYRGPIGNWLCALSYSQFTTKEFYNGTAFELIEKYTTTSCMIFSNQLKCSTIVQFLCGKLAVTQGT